MPEHTERPLSPEEFDRKLQEHGLSMTRDDREASLKGAIQLQRQAANVRAAAQREAQGGENE